MQNNHIEISKMSDFEINQNENMKKIKRFQRMSVDTRSKSKMIQV